MADVTHWWRSPRNEAHLGLVEVLNRMSGDIDERDRRWRRFLSILMQCSIPGFSGEKRSEEGSFRNRLSMEKRLIVNPAENCITTLGARIASQRPRAAFVVSTDGPHAWDQKQKAEGMEKAVAGEWQKNRFYPGSVKVFMDAGAIGFGAMKHWADLENRRVVIERTPPWELAVDESASMTTAPRSLYQRMWLAADVVKAMFPNRQGPGGKVSDLIDAEVGRRGTVGHSAGYVVTEDLVQVTEAWHLPAGRVDGDGLKINSPGAKGGRHSIVIEGCTLLDEVWPHERFPFSFFRWGEPIIGWYPQGLVEQVEGLQESVNKFLSRMQEAAHLYAVMHTYYEDGSINPKHLGNIMGAKIPYKKGSSAPQSAMPLSIPAELVRLTWDLYGKIYEGTGVSQMSASSVKPAGIESGKGLLVLKDSESGRHALLNNAWDDFHCDSAELTVQCAKDLAAVGKYVTKYVAHRKLERLDWSEIDLDRDAYEIAVFPTSMLPHEPAGRVERLEQLMQAGIMDPMQARALAFQNYPDMEQVGSLETAPRDLVEMQIADIMVRGKDVEPRPWQDLELAAQMATAALIRAETQGAPEDRLDLLQDYLDRVTEKLEAAAAAAASPPGPPMPGGPPPPDEMGPPEGLPEGGPPMMMPPQGGM